MPFWGISKSLSRRMRDMYAVSTSALASWVHQPPCQHDGNQTPMAILCAQNAISFHRHARILEHQNIGRLTKQKMTREFVVTSLSSVNLHDSRMHGCGGKPGDRLTAHFCVLFSLNRLSKAPVYKFLNE